MTLFCSGCPGRGAGAVPVDPPPTACPKPSARQRPDVAEPASIAGLDSFLNLVVGLTGAQGGAIRALTGDGEYLRLMAAVGVSEEFLKSELVVGVCGVCGAAVRDDDIRITTDGGGCFKLLSAQRPEGQFGHVIAVPLEYKGEPVGVFNLFFERPEDTHSEIGILLKPIGQLLGLTLENSVLERENSRAWLVHERQLMAADIHDSLAQTLAFARMRLPLLEDAIDANDRERSARYCRELDDELKRAHRGVRALITHFSEGADGRGLECELREVVERFRESSGIALDFDDSIPDIRLTGDSEVQLFFIVQEALANIRKHAGATQVRLAVDCVPGGIEVVVEDNGCGLDAAPGSRNDAGSGSWGLRIMRDRAQRFGGRVALESLPEGGARVRVFVPGEATIT